MLAQVIGDQTGALVGSRRATIRVFGNSHHYGAVVWHCHKLSAQQQCLATRLPGMWHLRTGGFCVPLDGLPQQTNARRYYHFVVVQCGAASQAYLPVGCVDLSGFVMNYVDALLCKPSQAELLLADIPLS